MPFRPVAAANVLVLLLGIGAASQNAFADDSPREPAASESPRTEAVGAAAQAGPAESTGAEAGQVVDTEEAADGATRVTFRSTAMDGEITEQTALLWEPTGPASGDVFAWAHSTAGLPEECAPSVARSHDPAGLQKLLAAGHVVVAPDYEGYGNDATPNYLVGESEGRSVLDALRAARDLTGSTGKSVVYGWSQGGHAALFAARMAPSYAPDVELVGAAAVAAVTDTASLLDDDNIINRLPGFVSILVAGYQAAYPDLRAEDVLGTGTAGFLDEAQGTCFPTKVADLPTDLSPEWAARLAENDPSAERIDVPVLLVHGELDNLLPAASAEAAHRRLCDLGSPSHLDIREGEDHLKVVQPPAIEGVIRWLTERLEGVEMKGCWEGPIV